MLHSKRFLHPVTILSALFLAFIFNVAQPASISMGNNPFFISPITPEHEQTELGPGHVFDDFKHLKIKKPKHHDNKPYWWVINSGDNRQFYDDHGDASSAKAKKKDGVTFARLQIVHDLTPADWDNNKEYIGAEISEYRTGYSYGNPGRWLPTPEHPVRVSTRVRFSTNYQQDGGGGAVGTAGLWLWNSYPDFEDDNPIYAFGFNWIEQGAAGGSGLQLTVFQNSLPVYNQSISTPMDMSAWQVWTMEWTVDEAGSQTIHWQLNEEEVGAVTLTTPFEALSLTMWNDNQFPTFLEDGQYVVDMHNPSSPQNFEIDWVSIEQPQ